jgi:hypothetical protein
MPERVTGRKRFVTLCTHGGSRRSFGGARLGGPAGNDRACAADEPAVTGPPAGVGELRRPTTDAQPHDVAVPALLTRRSRPTGGLVAGVVLNCSETPYRVMPAGDAGSPPPFRETMAELTWDAVPPPRG